MFLATPTSLFSGISQKESDIQSFYVVNALNLSVALFQSWQSLQFQVLFRDTKDITAHVKNRIPLTRNKEPALQSSLSQQVTSHSSALLQK